MGKLGVWGVAFGAVVLVAVGCDQELVLAPKRPSAMPEAGAPADGVTGQGGAPAFMADEPRLPVPDAPSYTTFGGAGAGGEAAGENALGGRAPGETQVPGTGGFSAPSGTAGAGAAGAPAEAGAGGQTATSFTGSLLFSEYLEGSGSFKALEIYAVTASSLDGCELQTYFNGKLEPGRLALHGELAAGELTVLCSSALADKQPQRCSRSTNLTFNGDDALVLSCVGTVQDSIGQMGVDPGAAWGGATADHTLRRRCTVQVGRVEAAAPFDPLTEWNALGPDIFDDLGVRSCPAGL